MNKKVKLTCILQFLVLTFPSGAVVDFLLIIRLFVVMNFYNSPTSRRFLMSKTFKELVFLFKIKGEEFQEIVSTITSGARKARLGSKSVFIKTENDFVVFSFTGEDLQVERKVKVEVISKIDIATTMGELALKVDVLPKDEIITVELAENLLNLRWGRSSKVTCETLPETAPVITIPSVEETVQWKAGSLQAINVAVPPFTALSASSEARRNPVISGVNLCVDDTGNVYVKATTGYRAIVAHSIGCSWFPGIEVSIPIESIKGLSDIFPTDVEIAVGMNDKQTLVVFKSGLTTAVSRLLVGKYPEIDGSFVTKGTESAKWTFDRMELIEVCRRVRKLSPNKPNLILKTEGSKVIAELRNVLTQQLGVYVEGEGKDFAVNAEYLEVAASLFRTEEVQLLFTNQNSLTVVAEETDMIRILMGQLELKSI